MSSLRHVVLALLAPTTIAAQQVPSAPLKPADATIKAPFTNVRTMHELSNGRVLLSDMMARMMGIGDPATGKFEAIDGLNPGITVSLAGDSSLVFGLQPQWVFLVGGRPIGMLPRDNPVVAASEGWVYGADSLGHLLTTHGTKPGMPGPSDSTAVVRVSRITANQDTVTWLWESRGPAAGGQPPVYSIFEQTLLTLDGWIAVLRTAPYRVDWRSPDGHWTLGAPIPVPVVPLDDREKRAYMVQRARGGTPKPPETITNWPDAVAPWTFGYGPNPSPDGKLLVYRTPTADLPATRYDVINRRGELERQVTMGANEKILGFGATSVYVTVTDKDGTQSVQRHPWP